MAFSRSLRSFQLFSVADAVREEAYRAGVWFANNNNNSRANANGGLPSPDDPENENDDSDFEDSESEYFDFLEDDARVLLS